MTQPAGRIVYTAEGSALSALLPAIADETFHYVGIARLTDIHLGPKDLPKLLFLDPELVGGDPAGILPDLTRFRQNAGVVVLVGEHEAARTLPEDLFSGHIPHPTSPNTLVSVLKNAFKSLDTQQELLRANEQLAVYGRELKELNKIGVALSAERDLDALLSLILRKAREITSADAGSLYLVEEGDDGSPRLRFKLTQGDSLDAPYQEFTMPMSRESLAGSVALSGAILNIGDVYAIPGDATYRFDPSWDRKSGYLTRSMVVVPMKNRQNQPIGILQLINRKRDPQSRLTSLHEVDRQVIAFDDWSEELLISMASQAGVAIENNLLTSSIQNLFEGFVKASVTAIEARDPTTSGHSGRVASLTVGLAEVVDRTDSGRFRDQAFSREQIREIRYASLLHDFGKVGVREEVLVKAKKLYPRDLDTIKSRFEYVKAATRATHAERKLAYILEKGREQYLAEVGRFDQTALDEMAELDRFLRTILEANEPTVLAEGNFETLQEIAHRSYHDTQGASHALLRPEEVNFLSIRRGTLDDQERLEIESHVVHTYRFLSQIPWTPELKHIPEIAHAHHEKLTGKGYPLKMPGEQIPVQSRMMTIADIYDALTASDRPYKKAVPVEKALDILGFEAKDGNIDRELLDLFIAGKVYETHSAAVD